MPPPKYKQWAVQNAGPVGDKGGRAKTLVEMGLMCHRCRILVFTSKRAAHDAGCSEFSPTINKRAKQTKDGALCAACVSELAS